MSRYFLRAGVRAVTSSLYYIRALRGARPDRLFDLVRSRAARPMKAGDALGYLRQLRRLTRYFLIRVLRYPQPCLALGCVLYEAALRLGLDASLVIGAAPGGGEIEGHCWLELGGAAFMESADVARYAVMLRG